jgi:hypothetical protein
VGVLAGGSVAVGAGVSPGDVVGVGGVHWVGVGASVSVGNGDVGEVHAASSHAAATSPASEKRERLTFLSIVHLYFISLASTACLC